MELHILTFIEQCSGLQGRRRCLAAGVLDIWHGTDPPDLGTARHGTSLSLGALGGAWIWISELVRRRRHRLRRRRLRRRLEIWDSQLELWKYGNLESKSPKNMLGLNIHSAQNAGSKRKEGPDSLQGRP
ncbi:MAG: hypothetical protein VX367_12700, partial [SAR324 cluster bacterium]|nr:hypothetical protein [SAR324 cluster bacterium]